MKVPILAYEVTSSTPPTGWGQIDVDESAEFLVYTTATIAALTTNWELTTLRATEEGAKVSGYVSVNINSLGGNTFTIFGRSMTLEELSVPLKVDVIYDSSLNAHVSVQGVPGVPGAAGDTYKTTSTTSWTIGTGSKAFTVDSGLAYSPGQTVIVAYDASNTGTGTVVSYSGTTLTINITSVTGSGTQSYWSINLSGGAGSGTGDVTTTGTVASDERIAVFDGVTGTKIKDGGYLISDLVNVIATGINVDTGSDNSKVVTSKALADSKYFKSDETVTLTNKTLTSPVLNVSISGSAFLDEDDMASNSDTKLASQQSIKAYSDAGDLWEVSSGKKQLKSSAAINMQDEKIENIDHATDNTDVSSLANVKVANKSFDYYNSYFKGDPVTTYRSFLSGDRHFGAGAVIDIDETTNKLMIITRRGTYHSNTASTNGGEIYYGLSTDGGATWSNPFVNTGLTGTDLRNTFGGIVKKGTNKGRFLLFYDDYSKPSGTDIHVSPYFTYSDDFGSTWSTPTLISVSGYQWAINIGTKGLLEWTENGTDYIGVPVYLKDTAGTSKAFGLLISNDNGATFNTSRLSDNHLTTTMNWGEPTMCILGDGIFLCVLRSQDAGTGGLYQYISYDYGNTWNYQGKCSFETTVITTDSSTHLLPSLSTVNIYGKTVVSLTYTNRTLNQLIRVLSLPENLIGSNGHTGWNTDTSEVLKTWGGSQSIDGNGGTCYPLGCSRGIYAGEDQNTNTDATLHIIEVALDEAAVAKTFNIAPNKEILNGSGAPDFIPYYVGQQYVDTNGFLYFAKGTSSTTDWVKTT